ncbi:MAG: hypothetical protein R6W70_08965 [bacterium]
MKCLSAVFLITSCFSLYAFTGSVITPPEKSSFNLPVTGMVISDKSEDFSVGGGLSLVYGIGSGFSADITWVQPFSFAADVFRETAFSFSGRYDLTFGKNNIFGVFLKGGGMVYGASDFVIPARTGITAGYRWFRAGAGIHTLFDINDRTEFMLWGAAAVNIIKNYWIQLEYGHSTIANGRLRNMFLFTFDLRL